MEDHLKELYQQVIMDHNRKPRNFREIEKPTHRIEGYNPLCGDRYTLFAEVENGKVTDVSFQGSGCAISKASASMMTEFAKGKSVEEVKAIFEKFRQMVSADMTTPVDISELGKLGIFAGVREFPSRVKCASLAWHTLNSALDGQTESVTTE